MVTWKVIQESVAELKEEDLKLGLKDLSVLHLPKGEAICKIFLQLFSPRWQDKLDKLNAAIEKQNSTEKGNKVRPFSEAEFLAGLGLIVGAVEYGNIGSSLWLNGKKKNDDNEWRTILPQPNFDRFMVEYHFKQFRQFFPDIHESASLKEGDDPWWRFAGAIDEFNSNHMALINASKVKVVDESMCACHPRTTATGGLPNISFIK
jgi:hypothetical protein